MGMPDLSDLGDNVKIRDSLFQNGTDRGEDLHSLHPPLYPLSIKPFPLRISPVHQKELDVLFEQYHVCTHTNQSTKMVSESEMILFQCPQRLYKMTIND